MSRISRMVRLIPIGSIVGWLLRGRKSVFTPKNSPCRRVFDKISTFAKTLAMDNFRISRLEINEIGPFGHLMIDFPEKPEGMADRAEASTRSQLGIGS
jgi:hypothetical protein